MRPAKSDRLKPQLRLYLERARRIACRYHVPDGASHVGEARIVSCITRDGDVLLCGSLIETVRQEAIVLKVSDGVQKTGGDLAFGILEDRFVDLHLLRTGNLAVVRLELQSVFVVVVAYNRPIRIERA